VRDADILVVGGAGFVGSNLVRAALQDGARRIVVVDNLLSSERENLPSDSKVEFIEGSIADDGVLLSIEDEFDSVFHLATFHGNQNSIADPLADHDNNLITTLKLFERLKGFERLGKVVYAASGCTLAPHEVYDAAEPTTEEGAAPFDLDSPYQISKVAGEFYAVYYQRQHGLPTVRARFQNVYGPGEILGAGSWRGTYATVWRNVAPTFIYRALKGLPLVLDNGGVASRDFIHVDDIVQGLLACAARGEPGNVYNLASGVQTTILRLAELVLELSGSASELEIAPRRPWDHSIMRFGSTKKAQRELDFAARVSLEEGLQHTIDWTRDNLALIDRCIGKHVAQLAQAS
jgi:nucleoside-diphosphate-sugar epimerase